MNAVSCSVCGQPIGPGFDRYTITHVDPDGWVTQYECCSRRHAKQQIDHEHLEEVL
jgi:hypothetical protein